MDFQEKHCPFCKEDNKCGVLTPSSCWCMKEKIPQELKDLLPLSKKNKSCICQDCVIEYKKNKENFKKKYK